MTSQAEQVPHSHVEFDEEGVPFIQGTTMKVIELVQAQRAHGWSPEELSFQYPYLSMARVHSALAYYWENKAALDSEIERRTRVVDNLRDSAQSPLAERLTSVKHH